MDSVLKKTLFEHSREFAEKRIEFLKKIEEFQFIEGTSRSANPDCPKTARPPDYHVTGLDLRSTVPPQNKSRAYFLIKRFIKD